MRTLGTRLQFITIREKLISARYLRAVGNPSAIEDVLNLRTETKCRVRLTTNSPQVFNNSKKI